MTYEATITIRRRDPKTLAGDFQAVTELLERRRIDRTAGPAPNETHPLRLVPSERERA